MKRKLQGKYVTISTVGETAQAFVPAPLPPCRPFPWALGGCFYACFGFQRRSNNELVTTLTLLNAIAAPAIVGLR
jgi:hypothetical protein